MQITPKDEFILTIEGDLNKAIELLTIKDDTNHTDRLFYTLKPLSPILQSRFILHDLCDITEILNEAADYYRVVTTNSKHEGVVCIVAMRKTVIARNKQVFDTNTLQWKNEVESIVVYTPFKTYYQ